MVEVGQREANHTLVWMFSPMSVWVIGMLQLLACDSRGTGRRVLDGRRLGPQLLHRLAYVISCRSLRERDES